MIRSLTLGLAGTGICVNCVARASYINDQTVVVDGGLLAS
jgi:NAD(P)-dependent dehydrogenase (short-subunit alcohol dehydrogenase family)